MLKPPEPTRLGEVVWARAISRRPARGCHRCAPRPGGPLRADRSHLPGLREPPFRSSHPRQLAVLILRDVLGFHASEVADMLDSTVDFGQKRPQTGRAPACQHRRPTTDDREPPPAADSPPEDAIVVKFCPRVGIRRSRRAGHPSDRRRSSCRCRRWPFEYQGPRRRGPLLAPASFRAGRRFDLISTRANGQPAFGAYRAPQPASATEPAFTSSPSPATGSAP